MPMFASRGAYVGKPLQLGVFAYQHVGGYLLLICAVSLFVISLKGIRLKRKPYATSGTRRIRLPRRNSR